MSKVGHYLQEHLDGEVVTTADVRHSFASDASIFGMSPSLVVYPRNENDVRKVARFTWQLAERNRIMPITARGGGSDLGGAAIGSGIMLSFPAHMNRILELDTKTGVVTVEPGINFGKLQQTLETHGRFLPPYPSSLEYSTIGGAVANNAGGEKSVKYGSMRRYVRSLRVVLANGEVILTQRLSKRELDKKLGLTTFEGEIYRSIDTLLEEQKTVVDQIARPGVARSAAGYELVDVKHKDGSFDLTPLMVGSQGTLGVITEVTLDTEAHNPETTLLLATLDNLQAVQSAVHELMQERDQPSMFELVNGELLQLVTAASPTLLKGLVEKPYPAYILFVEYDDSRNQKKHAKRGQKILGKYASHVQGTADPADQERFWRIRNVSAIALSHANNSAKALPIIDDGAVPLDKLGEFLHGVTEILERSHVQPAVWGSIGEGMIHVMPHLDLSQIGGRQAVFRIMDDYYKLVASLGGTTTVAHGDGRLRAPYLTTMYGSEVYQLFKKAKAVFDPYGTLNPGVKIDVTVEDIKPLIRQSYALDRFYGHLPRL